MRKSPFLFFSFFIFAVVGGVFAINLNIPTNLEDIPTPAKFFRSNLAVTGQEDTSNQENNILPTLAEPAVELDCYLCHEREFTKKFHVPEKIIKIENKKDIRRRLCVDCHGVEGANPNKQMSNPADITFLPETGVNGVFILNPDLAHQIHQKRMDKGQMGCHSCHITDPNSFDIEKPSALTERGQVLLCQNCKFHPEEGNYITIHVEISGLGCTTCHTGNILQLHQEATFKLGEG